MMATETSPVDWPAARRASYRVVQSFRYEYPQPIRDLNHRLVVIPPERFGDQRRLEHEVRVGLDGVRLEDSQDRFGNVVVEAFAPRVSSAIEFAVELSVERHAAEPNRLLDGWLADGYLLEPSRMTTPDTRIRGAADELAASASWGLDLADRINDWVYQSMTYQSGVTGVRTTAAEALARGAGVCQDYAHVMLAVCRACGLPSRYVSGHLLGQGGTHAWVEVVLPTNDGTGDAIAWPFDPTHASRGGLGYVTIAVGGDYSDVAPTSGTYLSSLMGRLMTRKTVTLTGLEYSAV
ncbi:MAG TPA: transglutaminase family protein [Candidatus Dormibacteraeota bacterium]|jgi:transglutaminase-like putative cysteine protease|nr:transglutaminase family protein [Candidatus Dormibacteraeota bacterium]